MNTINMNEFKLKQEKYTRQAENYRLIKSVKTSTTQEVTLIKMIGKVIGPVLSL